MKSRYLEQLIKRMEKHGYYYTEEFDCYKGLYCFRCNSGFPLVFNTQKEIAQCLKQGWDWEESF